MRYVRWTLGLGLIVLAVALFAPGRLCAQQSPNPRIGQVKTVSGDAVVIRNGRSEPVKIGDPVYRSDVLQTGTGTIGLTFVDNSVFSTGPGSILALQEFRFDPSATTNAMLAELRKGTLTIVSGEIPHRSGPEAMKIKTPTSILGIRGTTFAIAVR